ncbi:MAG: secondary thiamine-phosphate synthase enzyme YjbQ [Candidatus Kapaibacterium sp.]
MKIIQNTITLKSRGRGYHLVTDEIAGQMPELRKCRRGIAHIFMRHTSAGLTLNENADPSVRRDFESFFADLVPEDTSRYEHTAEGADDITAHIKSSMIGASVTAPVTDGKFSLGTWQGLYLCEFRSSRHTRNVTVTVIGEFDE